MNSARIMQSRSGVCQLRTGARWPGNVRLIVVKFSYQPTWGCGLLASIANFSRKEVRSTSQDASASLRGASFYLRNTDSTCFQQLQRQVPESAVSADLCRTASRPKPARLANMSCSLHGLRPSTRHSAEFGLARVESVVVLV
jgi:hypothetical protein